MIIHLQARAALPVDQLQRHLLRESCQHGGGTALYEPLAVGAEDAPHHNVSDVLLVVRGGARMDIEYDLHTGENGSGSVQNLFHALFATLPCLGVTYWNLLLNLSP